MFAYYKPERNRFLILQYLFNFFGDPSIDRPVILTASQTLLGAKTMLEAHTHFNGSLMSSMVFWHGCIHTQIIILKLFWYWEETLAQQTISAMNDDNISRLKINNCPIKLAADGTKACLIASTSNYLYGWFFNNEQALLIQLILFIFYDLN